MPWLDLTPADLSGPRSLAEAHRSRLERQERLAAAAVRARLERHHAHQERLRLREEQASRRVKIQTIDDERREGKFQAQVAEAHAAVAFFNVGWKAIVRDTCERHGLKATDLTGFARVRKIALARHEVCYRAAAETSLSYSEIGRRLCRDHSTAMHGVRQHALRNGLALPRGMQP